VVRIVKKAYLLVVSQLMSFPSLGDSAPIAGDDSVSFFVMRERDGPGFRADPAFGPRMARISAVRLKRPPVKYKNDPRSLKQ
jgi:hypothetical protein